MQTKDGGKHAGLPAYLPRKSDADMRRDGPGPGAHAPVDERGRLHGASEPLTASAIPCVPSDHQTTARHRIFWSIEANRRKSWIDQRRRARLRRQDKSVAVVGLFCSSDQWLIAFSLEGPAGSLWEFANDINAICAIHRCFRTVRSWLRLDGKGKAWTAAGRMSLKRLRLLESRQTPPAGAFDHRINDINTPTAIRCPSVGKLGLDCLRCLSMITICCDRAA